MLPACLPSQHALSCCLRTWQAGLAALAMALAFATPTAHAQEAAAEIAPETGPEKAGAPQETEQIGFEADQVEYNDNDKLMTARGNVVLRRQDQSVRADMVTWNSESGQILASGNVRVVDDDGNQFFTDSVELTDEFETGNMQNVLLALREGGRLAARSGRRDEQGNVVISDAVYSACEIETRSGCPKTPSWRIVAKQVSYIPDENIVRFGGARLELFGIIPVPLPGLSVSTDGSSTSGFLVPSISYSPSRNGLELAGTYYWQLEKNRDLSLTATVFSEAPPMLSGQYRALTENGAYQITGYATRSQVIPGDGLFDTDKEFRGYLFANGRFQLSKNWSITGSGRYATDRTFLRRYDISRDDRLRSMVDVERIDTNSYFSFAGWATQTMRLNTPQGQVPIALPAMDYRHRLEDPLLGGRIELQANTLAIFRTDGQDTQRAFAGARWDLTKLTGMGQEVTFTGLVRGDVYHSDENDLTLTPIYRGLPGWQTRGIATAAVDVKWPFAGPLLGGHQVLTPRLQLVASPTLKNLDVPNEDSRAIDLEDSNLFSLNRFPGYDRVEDGVRFTYGADWQWERPRWRMKATVGQSYRLTNKPTLLPNGTGLTSRFSDVVGRTEVRYRDFVKFTHRYRIDKDSFAVRRNEIDATVGNERTYAEIGYLRLNRDITAFEDLADREELRAAGRVAFARYWSVFGSGAFILTDREEDPLSTADGFEPLRTRVGAAYEDDCIELAFTWRRDYQTTGDAKKGNTFQIYFALRNLGF
ncbi:MAG: LPS assembly protein LptD [Novosphingobium sp.]